MSILSRFRKYLPLLGKNEDKLIKLNRILKALGKSSQAMVKATDEESYLNEVCRIVVEDCNFAMVWIGYAIDNPEKMVQPVAYYGFDKGYLENLNITWADNERGRGPTGTAIRNCKPVHCKDIITDPAFTPWKNEALKRGYASSIVFPLVENGRAFGAINIYSHKRESFDAEEINCLTELASDLTYGILSIRARENQVKIEQALRVSGEYQRHLLNSLIEGFCVVEVIFDQGKPVDYRFVEVNTTFESLTGLSNVEGKLISEVIPENEQYWYEIYGKVAMTGEPAHFFNQTKALNRWFDVRAFRLTEPKINHVAICFNDITEQKRAEEALIRSEEKYSAIHDNTPIAIALSKMPEGTITSVNNAFSKIFGYTRDQIIGKSFTELGITDENSKTEISEALMQNGFVQDFECTRYANNGQWLQVLVNLNWVTIGNERQVLTTIKNITERKQFENAIQQSEQQLRVLFETMQQGTIYQDKNGIIISANPAAEEILGKTREQLIGCQGFLNNNELIHPDGTPFSDFENPASVALRTGKKVNNVTVGFYNEHSGYRWINIDSVPIFRNEDDSPYLVYTLFNDITRTVLDENEKRMASEKLNNYARHLKELNSMKDKFFWTIAHDLKNPFTVLMLASEILCEDNGSMSQEEVKTVSKSIFNSAKNGFALLENLMEWSRSQTGNLKFNPKKINLKKLVDTCIGNIRIFLETKNIDIKCEMDCDVEIFGDENMLNTVLRNLLNNAMKFTHRNGLIRVMASKEEDQTIIIVKDNGTGISQQNQHKIFRIDTHFSCLGTDKEKGTGLGLLLCKEFVEKHGGKIWVESVEGAGSEFKFSIPEFGEGFTVLEPKRGKLKNHESQLAE